MWASDCISFITVHTFYYISLAGVPHLFMSEGSGWQKNVALGTWDLSLCTFGVRLIFSLNYMPLSCSKSKLKMDCISRTTVRIAFINSEKLMQTCFYSKQSRNHWGDTNFYPHFIITVSPLNDREWVISLSIWNVPQEMCKYSHEKPGFWIQTALDFYPSDFWQVT